MALYHHHLHALLCVLLFVSPSLLAIKGAFSLPSSTFCGDKPNGVYPNPVSCSSFWACWDNGLKGSLLLCPPNSVWSQPSLSCTHITALPNTSVAAAYRSTNSSSPSASVSTSSSDFNASLQYGSSSPPNASFIASSSSPSSNSSVASSFLSSCGEHDNMRRLPIWSWDGVLHCYGYGCLGPQKPNFQNNQFDIGVPCTAAEELIAIAKHSKQAWVLAPHQVLEGDQGVMGGKHWKINLDAVREAAETGLTMLKASIVDYSPAQRVRGSWQGGGDARDAQFALKGPRTSPQGRCYYSISLESPDVGGMWAHFTRDFIAESERRRGATRSAGLPGVGNGLSTQPQQQQGGGAADLFHQRLQHGGKSRFHTSTLQGCLKIMPWSSLVATALCYASNAAGGARSVALCSDFSATDLFSIAKCFTTLLGISSELGI